MFKVTQVFHNKSKWINNKILVLKEKLEFFLNALLFNIVPFKVFQILMFIKEVYGYLYKKEQAVNNPIFVLVYNFQRKDHDDLLFLNLQKNLLNREYNDTLS